MEPFNTFTAKALEQSTDYLNEFKEKSIEKLRDENYKPTIIDLEFDVFGSTLWLDITPDPPHDYRIPERTLYLYKEMGFTEIQIINTSIKTQVYKI